MAHVSLLDHALPDTSGNVFFESYAVKATNDFWPFEVCIFNDSGADNFLACQIRIPDDYSSAPVLKIKWTSTATSGNVRWAIAYRGIGGDDAESMDQATAIEKVEVTDAAPSAAHERNLVAMAAVTSGNFVAGETLEIRISREGLDAADTMAAAAILFDAYLEYTAA